MVGPDGERALVEVLLRVVGARPRAVSLYSDGHEMSLKSTVGERTGPGEMRKGFGGEEEGLVVFDGNDDKGTGDVSA